MARGTLRIYLGAAAGVGKTFAMLNEGHRRAEYGEDVVVGLVETHGRRKTAEQIEGLEVVPRRRVDYRGSSFEELNVAGVLARKPQVVLVDELAHTNVPGSRNEKRWQDVDELLAAGITVISTLNIQHLESLNDVVEQITGVTQRETIPDAVVRRADELQLVDLTPVALRNRLARGDVYPSERIDTALANYFRPGNLSALRELALAWLADRVDEALAEYRERHGITEPWETRERILVALTGSTDGERLVRRAARVAQRTKGDLVAVHVIPQDGLAAPSAELLERQRTLVEELGGMYHEVVGADVGEVLLEAARSLNVTQIVMGASRRSRWQRLTRGSVIGRVIRESGVGIDVHVISHPGGRSEDAFLVPRTRRPATLPRRRVLLGFALAAAGLPLLTWMLSEVREDFGLPTVMLLYLLLVVLVSALGGLWPALAAAVLGFLLVNWYFVPPLHTLEIRSGEHILSLAVFLTVAAVVSGFVSLASRRAVEGRRARAEAEVLARLAGSAAAAPLLETLRRVLGLEGAAVLHRHEGGWRIEAATGDRVPESPAAASLTLDLDPEHVLVLAGPPLRSEDQRVLDAFARELAASVELGELEAEAQTAGALSAANELRAALLSAVSHDLRTPLAAIKASVTSLRQRDVDWPVEDGPFCDPRSRRNSSRAPARHKHHPAQRLRLFRDDQRSRAAGARRRARRGNHGIAGRHRHREGQALQSRRADEEDPDGRCGDGQSTRRRTLNWNTRPSRGLLRLSQIRWRNDALSGGYNFDAAAAVTPMACSPSTRRRAPARSFAHSVLLRLHVDSPGMIMRLTDIGSQYLMASRLRREYFDGGKTYKVTLPPNIPAAAFWSFTVYDNQTRSMLDTPQRYPRAGSQSYPSPAARRTPTARRPSISAHQPAGVKAGNWIQTDARQGLVHAPAPLQPAGIFPRQGWRPSEIELVK